MKRVQYRKSAKCNMKKVQHEETATRKKCKMNSAQRKEQLKKSAT